jgi:hypothetical protein
LPQAFAWERFATEERKVSWDGYLSYDGVLYGLPSSPPVAGLVGMAWDTQGLACRTTSRRTGQASAVADARRAS